MELHDYLRILRSHWIGVTLLAVAGVLAAGAYSLSQPKVYAADAAGFVSTGVNNNPALGSVGDSLAKSRAKSYVDIAKSRATASAVIDQLGLSDAPAALIGNISVDQPADTVLLKISARAATPEQAQALADAWVTALASEVAEIENPDGKPNATGLRVVPVEAAALPSSPISPRTRLNLLVGLLLGLLLGLVYAVVRNQLDRRIRSADVVEKDFGVPVVGAVPQSPGLAHKPGERAPIAVGVLAHEASSGEGEAFRKLRTNLAYMNVDDPPRVIVVTSPKEGDGKSTVAINIAAAMAASDRQVVLVDGDLRRPTVAESFGLAEGVGLTDLLIGRVHKEDALQTVSGTPTSRCSRRAGSRPTRASSSARRRWWRCSPSSPRTPWWSSTPRPCCRSPMRRCSPHGPTEPWWSSPRVAPSTATSAPLWAISPRSTGGPWASCSTGPAAVPGPVTTPPATSPARRADHRARSPPTS